MTDPLHTEPVEVTQAVGLSVVKGRDYRGLYYIEGAPFRISFWTYGTDIDPVEGQRRLDFAHELVAAWNTRTAAEAVSRQEVEALRQALVNHNDVLRSAYQIAARKGAQTEWEGFTLRAGSVLHFHHEEVEATRAALTASEGGEA